MSIDKKKNVLFLTPRFPFPLIGGDRVKPYYLLKYLALKYNVTLITFFQGYKIDEKYLEEIKKLGVKVRIVYLNPLKAGLNAFFYSFKKFPLEIGFYYNREFQKIVDYEITNHQPEIAFSFFMRTAEYLKNHKVKKILIAEDCRTVYQNRSFLESFNIKQKLVRYWEWKKLAKYEPKIVNYFNFTTLVTNNDIEAMKLQNDSVNYRLLTNGTNTDFFMLPFENKRKGILFAGKLDIWANVIMIKKIITEIFPLICQSLPEAELTIVGANPPISVKKLIEESKNKINFYSNVPSMLPYLQNAQVFLHPHSGASGIQNKLIEAMACGLPVVTSNTGNQGIDGTDGKQLMIANNTEEFANKVIQILLNQNLAFEVGQNARKHIEEKLSWNAVYVQLDYLIEEILNEK